MIQRIQTVWLLFAVLLNVALFFTNIYTASDMTAGVSTVHNMQITNIGYYSLLVAALVIIIMPLIAIFLFHNRKLQRNVIVGGMITHFGFISLMLMSINKFNSKLVEPSQGHYSLGAVLPALSLIFLILAIIGVMKDDKLVKSSDRLR